MAHRSDGPGRVDQDSLGGALVTGSGGRRSHVRVRLGQPDRQGRAVNSTGYAVDLGPELLTPGQEKRHDRGDGSLWPDRPESARLEYGLS